MATFVVEDGTGLATANSYADVAAADAELENYLEPADYTTWTGLSSEVRQLRLRQGTRYLDTTYGPRKIGVKANEAQALEWPVTGLYDDDGILLSSTAVPSGVVKAAIMAAWRQNQRVAAGSALLPDLTAGDVTEVKEKFAVFEQTTKYASGAVETPVYTEIDGLMAPYVQSEGRVVLG